MVTRSVCLFLLVGSLIQVNDATSSVVVIAQYTPKFVSLSLKVAKVTGEGTAQILKTQYQIKKLVDTAERNVNQQLVKLNKFVKESISKATKSGVNITSCVTNERTGIENIHLNVLDKCRLQDGVKHLYIFSLKLAKEEVSISLAVQWCIAQFISDGDKLKTCFDNKIDDVEGKIKEFQKEMETTLPEALEYSNSCTAKYLRALNVSIERVYWNFKNCIDEIFP